MNVILRRVRRASNERIIKYEMAKMKMPHEEAVTYVNTLVRDFCSEAPKKTYDATETELLAKRKRLKDRHRAVRRWIFNRKKDFLYFFWFPLVFRISSLAPVNPRQILFVNDKVPYLPDNMQPIYQYFKKQGYKTITCLQPRKSGSRLINALRHTARTTKFSALYARSGMVFLTEYYLPAYANKPRKGTQVIQLWHACGAFKRWGYSTIDAEWGGGRESLERYPVHNTYTSAMVSAPKVIPCYADAFHCSEEIVLPLGTPRTDIYYDARFVSGSKERMRQLFPQIGDRKIILYAPTFRGNSIKSSFTRSMMDYMLLKRMLGKDYVLINKLHPLVAKGFTLNRVEQELYGDFVFDASKDMPIERALCAADIVISDYSSLIFEYALLERPMMFFAYDLKDYDRSRSFYFPYKDFVPGPIVRDTMEIVDAVRAIEKNFDVERVRKFRQDFMSACDGHSTERIVEYVIRRQKEEIG